MKKYWNKKIETMPRSELEKLQLKLLKEELAFAFANSEFYKKSFDAVHFDVSKIKDLSDISKLPLIDKNVIRDCQGKGSFLGELATVPEKDVVFVSTSSGSTGVPTMSPFTQKDFQEWQDVESRFFWQMGMRPNDRYIHALNFSLYVGGPDVIGAQNLGALCIWGGTLPSERLLYILKAYQPTIIWTSPSYAWQLGDKAIKNGYNPKKDFNIQKIIVAGECGGSIKATKEAIENIWGAEVFDFYGISDIFGACAAMCSEKNGLHIAEDHILVETIDPKTQKVLEPGSIGELVFTTLRKKGRPLIRFRTGDIGKIDYTPCECGRTHGRIHVYGRADDMFIVSAVNVFPSDIEAVIRADKNLTGEYLIRIFDENYTSKFIVEVEKKANTTFSDTDVIKNLEASLKARIGVRPAQIILHQDGELDTRSEHKSRRIIDTRNKPNSV